MGWFGGILQEVEPRRKFPLDLFGTPMSGLGSMHMCTVAVYPEAKRLWLRQNIFGSGEARGANVFGFDGSATVLLQWRN